MFYTLDYNCIIALENEKEELQASYIRKLIALAKRANIPLYGYAYLFLENLPKGKKYSDVPSIKDRLDAIGLGHVELRAMGTIGFIINGTPWTSIEVEQEFIHWVHQTMFPNIPFYWEDYLASECKKQQIPLKAMGEANWDRQPPPIPHSPSDPIIKPPETLDTATKQQLWELWESLQRKWNNAKSDSLALAAHISWGDGVFITNNSTDFQRHEAKLRKRVPNLKILTPKEALEVTAS